MSKIMVSLSIGAALLLAFSFVSVNAQDCPWSPIDPDKMHHPQLPDPFGWDINATAPVILAEDWQCSETGYIKEIHFWGMWRNMATGNIGSFTLGIWSDMPEDEPTVPYSRPFELLWTAEITDFVETPVVVGVNEGWYDPVQPYVLSNHSQAFFQYDICLPEHQWFVQTEGHIYWLSISANVHDPATTQWGWKTTLDNFSDNAVYHDPGGHGDYWLELSEPGSEHAITNAFYVEVDDHGGFTGGSGEDAYGDGWYYYPTYDWWNVWFYDHPYNTTRYKTVQIAIDVYKATPGAGLLELAVNWSTAQWSIDMPGVGSPPLPGVDEDLYIGRHILFSDTAYEGNYQLEFELPDYNPEWVSIDVRGSNFIVSGAITHECLTKDPYPFDLSFVVTSGPVDSGACCILHQPTGYEYCSIVDETECVFALGGTYLGDNTECGTAQPCCLPDSSCVALDSACCENMGGTPMGVDYSCELENCEAVGACCHSTYFGPECDLMTEWNCIMLPEGGYYKGDGSECGSEEVACCFPDSWTCEVGDANCCEALGGYPLTPGLGCDSCNWVTGACCYRMGEDWDCRITTEENCGTHQEFAYLGDGTECGSYGACCLPSGDCTMIDSGCCVEWGGIPMGAGTQCSSFLCADDSGACCYSDPPSEDRHCVYTDEDDCISTLGGTFLGEGLECGGEQACCLPTGECITADSICCEDLGGFPMGTGSDCSVIFCLVECCGQYTDGITGNTNCSEDGKITLSDITRTIDKVYISKLPLCCPENGNTNGSEDGKITLSDITRQIDAVYISKEPPEPCIP